MHFVKSSASARDDVSALEASVMQRKMLAPRLQMAALDSKMVGNLLFRFLRHFLSSAYAEVDRTNATACLSLFHEECL